MTVINDDRTCLFYGVWYNKKLPIRQWEDTKVQKIHGEVAKDVGLIIRYHRKKEGLSQDELARRVGISRTYLNSIENQRRIPSFLMFKEIANQLGKTTIELGLEALSENCDGELLALRAIAAVKKVIRSGDKKKQQKLVEFMESLEEG